MRIEIRFSLIAVLCQRSVSRCCSIFPTIRPAGLAQGKCVLKIFGEIEAIKTRKYLSGEALLITKARGLFMNAKSFISRTAMIIALSSPTTILAQTTDPQAASATDGAAIIVTGPRLTGMRADRKSVV